MGIIEFEDVTYEYSENAPALNHIYLRIEKGEYIAVIGHNGSGKSTLAKHINALFIPSSGTVRVMGMDTRDEQNTIRIRSSAGMVFQNPDNQMVTTIVEEDIAFGPENLGIPSQEIRSRVDQSLKDVNMTEYASRAPHQLSGGQKQRIAIAGVLAMHPDIIVLDEPTAMLDPEGRKEVLQTLERLNKEEGMTIVLITHFMDEAARADRIFVVSQGNIVMQGVPKDIFQRADELTALGLDVPFAVRLSRRLQEAGWTITQTIEQKELVREICQYASRT